MDIDTDRPNVAGLDDTFRPNVDGKYCFKLLTFKGP